MWQRIQTLYLFLSTALSVSLIFCDKAVGVSYRAYVPYLVLLVLIGLLDILALGTYKVSRVFQMRTTVLSALLSLSLQAWLAVDFFVTGNDPAFYVTAVFPLVTVILDILAVRGIWADELMVRSASRLRSPRNKKH